MEHLAELLSFSAPDALVEDGVAGVAVDAPPCRATAPREDRQRWEARQALTLDAARPQAVAKRHALGMRTARENIADLCDEGSFLEYGALAVAAQRQRRSEEDLIANTPADGMVTGIGSVNGHLFGEETARTVVMAYDATVLAGTQGMRNHQKTDRLLGIALAQRLPVVLFAEGGGGRPGDTDMPIVAGSACGHLCGLCAPVGPGAGGRHRRWPLLCGQRRVAGLQRCDHRHAQQQHRHGWPGHGGGRWPGCVQARRDRAVRVQAANGVIDMLVDDEAQAVAAARHYLSFFQGRVPDWTAPDAEALRDAVPENRLRVYDSQVVMEGLVDVGSLLVLRRGFGAGIHTALARIEGRPVGSWPTTPTTWVAPSTPTRPTRRRASCNCATPTACRW